MVEKYNLTAENIYNWDEKGFLIGLALKMKRIMSRQSHEEGKLQGAMQDGSREFITLLACICADMTALPAALIYQGKSQDLMDTWLDDLEEHDIAYFASSEKGWSSDAYGMAWLNKVFDPHTRDKAKRSRRLLIVDGHSSHVNMAFIDRCDRLKILVLILPPHSTHKLQPLDCGNFLPLAIFYGQEITAILTDSEGETSMTKRMFYGCFKPAFEKAFCVENIESAWKKTGLWPYDPSLVLDPFKARPNTDIPVKTEVRDPNEVKTPYTSKSIRHFQAHFAKNPTKQLQRKLFKANMQLAAEREIATHRAECFKRALILEKKKRNKPKRLNLLGEDASGVPQFFGPEEVKKAREFQAGKAAREEQEKVDKAVKKAKDAEDREEKKAREAAEKAAKAEKRELDRQVAREAKAQAKIEAAEARKANAAVKKAVKAIEKAAKAAKPSRIVILKVGSTMQSSLGSKDQVEVEEVEDNGGVVPVMTRRGRKIELPVRLRI